MKHAKEQKQLDALHQRLRKASAAADVSPLRRVMADAVGNRDVDAYIPAYEELVRLRGQAQRLTRRAELDGRLRSAMPRAL